MRRVIAKEFLIRPATALFALVIASCVSAAGATLKQQVTIAVSQSRAEPGQTVSARITATKNGSPSREKVHAVLLRPSVGTETISLHPVSQRVGLYSADVSLPKDAPQGLYVIHAWTGNHEHPSAMGEASFLSGGLVGDFLIASALDQADPAADLIAYLNDFDRIGGNFLVAHNLITPDRAYFPCAVCKRGIDPKQEDLVELLLTQADKRGYAVLLSVSWDMTHDAPYDQRMAETKNIMKELLRRYSRHPSFAGFYSFQEGSGTYYVPYIREFSRYAKTLDPDLLVACAPYIDDPLLAGYLSTLKDLDIIIWQSGVMGSYRPDNRKQYPARRVKDFCSLATGAKLLQGKIALTHVELFGYLEKRLAPDIPTTGYRNIYQQILSAATVSNNDGIMLFTYQYHIHNVLKKHPEILASRKAVVDGLAAFNLIASRISHDPNPLELYFPYSDWVVERWTNSFLPALDAFRVLGIPVDVLPYAPPLAESLLPYYPIHMNQSVLARLLRERTILVLPDVSGFQQTDSDLVKAFVQQGGTVIAFGPQIPMGRSYERDELFGGAPLEHKQHSSLVIEKALGSRVSVGTRVALHSIQSPSWVAGTGEVIAKFEDGSAAILVNSYGKGRTITILPDASSAAQEFPELIRDAIDYALANTGAERAADLVGADARMDVAIGKLRDGFSVAVVNHNSVEKEVTVRALKPYLAHRDTWIDAVTGTEISGSDEQSVTLRLPADGFRAIEFKHGVSVKSPARSPNSAVPEHTHE
jgi:hypothetical protein